MKNTLLLLLLITGSVQIQAQNIAGKAYTSSDCYSGEDFDYYFFEDSTVLAKCVGCDAKPYIRQGKWTVSGKEVHYTLTKEWKGKGVGNPIKECDINCEYNLYNALFSQISKKGEIPLQLFEEEYKSPNCFKVKKHELKKSDPHAMLKTEFLGRFPQSSQRPLSTSDFKGMMPSDLKIMRNEIYARYGYIFKTKDMEIYFSKQVGYKAKMENVDAFLSELEQKNIAMIKKYEPKH